MTPASASASDMGRPETTESEDELAALLEAELAGTDEDNEAPASDVPAAKKPRPAAVAAGVMPDASAMCPPHPGFMGGICIRCGTLKGEAEEQGVALSYIHRGLEVSKHEAERMRQGTADRLLAHRKLLLILDLDHTLLNSTRFQEVPPQGAQRLRYLRRGSEAAALGELALRAQLEAQPQEGPMLFQLLHMRMWTKLRPGVREFLEQAKDRFELAVYTMGDRDYAGEMAKLLDPSGQLFHGRIISSGDSTQRHVKDLDVVLGRERVVLVLDDTEGVWPRHRDNLVQIERYLYFPADAARFGFRSQSLLERAVDEEGAAGALTACLRVMLDVQEQFFAQGDPANADVRPLLRAARRGILAGVHILFSRVMPLDCRDPSAHPLWQLAQKLGAECLQELGEGVTHVVATDTTDKTRWAHSQGKHVVSPSWLWCCAYTWRRADEDKFAVMPRGTPGAEMAASKSEGEDVAQVLAAVGGGTLAEASPAAKPAQQPAAYAAAAPLAVDGPGKNVAMVAVAAAVGDNENVAKQPAATANRQL